MQSFCCIRTAASMIVHLSATARGVTRSIADSGFLPEPALSKAEGVAMTDVGSVHE
jgi:hypothetical protein